MAEVVVESEVDSRGRSVACAKLTSGDWEVNVRATPDEFAVLGAIRGATWAARTSLAVGSSVGAPVFWSCDGPTASILIGSDDETWDIAISVPIEIVDQIVELVRDL